MNEQARGTLRDIEANLHSLLQNATAFALYRLAVDPTHPHLARVVLVSPSLADIIGISDPLCLDSWFEGLHPEDRDRVVAANDRAIRTGTRYDEITRFYHAVKRQWVWVHTISTPIFDEQGRLTHFDGLVVDVTDQKQAEERLQHQIAFENLVTTISTRFINLDLAQIDDGIVQALESIGRFTDVDRSYVFTFSEDGTRFSCTHEWSAHGTEPQIDALQDLPTAEWAWSNTRILSGQVLHIPCVADLPVEASVERREFERQGIRSLIAVPMIYRGTVLGFLGFDAVRTLKTWSEQDITLLKIVGETFVNALEHKQGQEALQRAYQLLEQRVGERTREIEQRRRIAESLRDIVAAINANLPLEDILGRIVQQASLHLNATACVLSRIDYAEQQFVHEATYGWPAELQSLRVIPFHLQRETGSEDYRKALLRRQPTYGNYGPLPDRLDEIRSDPNLPPEIKARRLLIRAHFAGSMGVPLAIGEQVYGGLAFYYAEPQGFAQEQVQVALTFAEQAALAIQNAQLREQAARSAAQAERNRLARDLHDAVTQTLFSASLIAEVLPHIWERNPQEGQRRLGELRELTRGALAEMRALLLELRPSALVEANLGDLLRQLGEALAGRARIRVKAEIDEVCAVPADVKVALYRIAQEALNNVAKHAQARRVEVSLKCQADSLVLRIHDDGLGFDLDNVPSDHFGLGNMHERAAAIGARLSIGSEIGQGAEIQVEWPKDDWPGANGDDRA